MGLFLEHDKFLHPPASSRKKGHISPSLSGSPSLVLFSGSLLFGLLAGRPSSSGGGGTDFPRGILRFLVGFPGTEKAFEKRWVSEGIVGVKREPRRRPRGRVVCDKRAGGGFALVGTIEKRLVTNSLLPG